MEQHPIPQQISSYQFRLVGDMTLKQFFQIAGGALISLLFYASHLHPIIKWPFIIFFTLLGVALAFLPLEERPLEKWIFAFFRSVYSPTLFNWKKTTVIASNFQPETFEASAAIKTEDKIKEVVPASTIPSASFLSKLEGSEGSFLSKLNSLFAFNGPIPSQAVASSTPTSQPGVKTPFQTPVQTPVRMERPKVTVEEKPVIGPYNPQVTMTGVSQTLRSENPLQGSAAQFSVEATPPNPPTVPNTVVGQVLDNQGKIIEGAILEIRDVAGRPVRALKSNKLGHFIIVTPLMSGRYQIITEKDNYTFEPVTFDATGAIIPPIAIQGKGQPNMVVSEQTVSSQQLMNQQ
jgi:hypothetical protein